MSENPREQPPSAGSDAAAQQPLFQIEKLYVKDLSLEVPNAPQVFMQAETPQLEIQLRNEAIQIADGLYDVAVTVTVTAKAGEKTLFLAEATQCGIFQIRGIPPGISIRCSASPARRCSIPTRARRSPTW